MSEKRAFTPTVRYSKPSKMEDGTACMCYSSEEEATAVKVEIDRHGGSMCFERQTFTGRDANGKIHEKGKWPYEFRELMRMLECAYMQGRRHQKADTADVLRQVTGLS